MFDNLKKTMERHGVTVEQMANATGQTKRTIQNKLNGKSNWYCFEVFNLWQKIFKDKVKIDPIAWLFDKGEK